MPVNWTIKDIYTVETSPTSPSRLQWKISEILLNSLSCRCKVDSVNADTGEYRIVLNGTLDTTDERPGPSFTG
ncbi:MAG TPA: hypothetical protein VNA25_13635 [Phycisphaerae bacterium]|nr:hypothetical protein [Phycisphaerae bacterium]